ncbi:MAG: YdeI/OmpD-associated family protein [Chitinophagaceae bacterium]|nr:YdeI/OmpD-associated family protein [Chitinophagaceae bacterium]
MAKPDPRIDAYIAKAAPFAQPILKHLRKLVHQGCPELEETIKWGFPSFDYKGPFCSIAAFKAHCVFGFWKTALLNDPKGILSEKNEQRTIGCLGRITDIKDLPSDKIILGFIKQAKKLNDDGVKLPARIPKEKKELVIPDYFLKAIKKNKTAFDTYTKFSPSAKRDYIEWIVDAKAEETRNRRMETAVEWMAEGKQRHWKYKK